MISSHFSKCRGILSPGGWQVSDPRTLMTKRPSCATCPKSPKMRTQSSKWLNTNYKLSGTWANLDSPSTRRSYPFRILEIWRFWKSASYWIKGKIHSSWPTLKVDSQCPVSSLRAHRCDDLEDASSMSLVSQI